MQFPGLRRSPRAPQGKKARTPEEVEGARNLRAVWGSYVAGLPAGELARLNRHLEHGGTVTVMLLLS